MGYVSATQAHDMIVTHHRDKLIQAIIFFAQHTKHCGKTKLFKLLYLLDFEHFRLTGRSVTGLEYYAWEKGPVPVALEDEWDEFKPDLALAIRIKPERLFSYSRQTVTPRLAFDDSYFSKRELGLMREIAEKYRSHLASEMVEVTHAENGAWDKVWANGEGHNQLIDYRLSLEGSPVKEHIERAAEEYSELLARVSAR